MSNQVTKKATATEETKNPAPETKPVKVPMKKKVKDWCEGHPKTMKWVKRVGVSIGWAASVGLAWMAGERKGFTETEPTSTCMEAKDDTACETMEENSD